MRLILRVLLILAFAIWQGGFMFYGGVVVPVGAQIIGSELQQGFVTQAVTNYLNLFGGICLAIWAVELSRLKQYRRIMWALWSLLAITLLGLVVVHLQMDRLLDESGQIVLNDGLFHWCHRFYLGLSTLQWGASVGLLALTMAAWSPRYSSSGTDIP